MNTVGADNAENDNMACSFKITINSDQNNDVPSKNEEVVVSMLDQDETNE